MKIITAVLATFLLAAVAFGQSAPTLRIVTDDPNLPSDLYYGNIKVKPLRLRPGTNQPITIDDSDFFVQQHYIDFLNRMPEPGGFQAWLNILNTCTSGDSHCDRVEVSSGFFRSTEFQVRGYFVFRFYDVALGRKPDYTEFMPDLRRVTGFLTDQQIEDNKVALINDFMSRPAFHQKYDAVTDPTAYVKALEQTAGAAVTNDGLLNPTSPAPPIVVSNEGTLIADLTAGRQTRAQVLRNIVESPEVDKALYNQAFVVMQYFGYLRRDPDNFYHQWIATMNSNGGDYRTMISGFVNSLEYRNRF